MARALVNRKQDGAVAPKSNTFPWCLLSKLFREFPECFTVHFLFFSTGGLQIGWLVGKIKFYSVTKAFRTNGYRHDNTDIDIANFEMESSSVLEAEQNEDMLSLT